MRKETLSRGVGTGGLCRVKGVPTIFLDEKANADTQVEVLAGVLRRFDWSGVELPAAVAAVLAPRSSRTADARADRPAA